MVFTVLHYESKVRFQSAMQKLSQFQKLGIPMAHHEVEPEKNRDKETILATVPREELISLKTSFPSCDNSWGDGYAV